MKKLFIVVNVDWFFLSHRKDIAIAAQAAGYDVSIVTNDTGKLKDIDALGLKTINLPMKRSNKKLGEELKVFKFLYDLYNSEKPDVVHHVGLKTILWGALAAKLVRVKGVVNAVSGLGIFFSEDNKSLVAKVLLKVLKWSHNRKNLLVIFQNDEDKDMFLKHSIIRKEQAKYIKGSGVNLEQFCFTSEPTESKIKVLMTARMIVEKGVFVLTEAAEKLRQKYEDKVEFLLCGGLDDNPTSLKKEDMDRICDGEYIQWLGYRTDVLELLKQSHIVAFPSYYKEGLPKSLIEATAIGRAIITTDNIGCREAVEDGVNGFLIPIKDSNALAEKLDVLVSDGELRRRMGENGRKIAERDFSINEVIKRHLNIYNELTK
ncbi:glycosyltransferase family 4 protein [Bacteroides bouchesdurhonensis]|uniref:glycosyltransferase family 4 protein n=1 Tax=Bacteroides bouchesdurhonensis TaxID=1841855 RepID=UPI00097F846D|nr:glycosyltransferase family 4 protein [Bacteroides bouchesdurhonensis]